MCTYVCYVYACVPVYVCVPCRKLFLEQGGVHVQMCLYVCYVYACMTVNVSAL